MSLAGSGVLGAGDAVGRGRALEAAQGGPVADGKGGRRICLGEPVHEAAVQGRASALGVFEFLGRAELDATAGLEEGRVGRRTRVGAAHRLTVDQAPDLLIRRDELRQVFDAGFSRRDAFGQSTCLLELLDAVHRLAVGDDDPHIRMPATAELDLGGGDRHRRAPSRCGQHAVVSVDGSFVESSGGSCPGSTPVPPVRLFDIGVPIAEVGEALRMLEPFKLPATPRTRHPDPADIAFPDRTWDEEKGDDADNKEGDDEWRAT